MGEEPVDRLGLHQLLPEQPDGGGIGNRAVEPKAQKSLEGQPVLDLKLGRLVRQCIERLQHQDLEHQHRVERRPSALAAITAPERRHQRPRKTSNPPPPTTAPTDRPPRSTPRNDPKDRKNLADRTSPPPTHRWRSESNPPLKARVFRGVQLIPPQYVKPYVKRGKNDAADAEALCEAVTRPSMRFVPVKSRERQAACMLMTVRERLVSVKSQLSNAFRSYAAEFGIVGPAGRQNVKALMERVLEDASLPRWRVTFSCFRPAVRRGRGAARRDRDEADEVTPRGRFKPARCDDSWHRPDRVDHAEHEGAAAGELQIRP